MQSRIVSISQFRFKKLRKLMTPIYSLLESKANMPMEEKKDYLQYIIVLFCTKLREFSRKSLGEISITQKINISFLTSFENYEKLTNKIPIIKAYLDSCGGHDEFDYFHEKVREFVDSDIKESNNNIIRLTIKNFENYSPELELIVLPITAGRILQMPFSKDRNSAFSEK